MARLVIKSFKDKKGGGVYYSDRLDVYKGDREEELFAKGYLADELKDLRVADLKNILDKKGIEYKGSDKKQRLIELAEE